MIDIPVLLLYVGTIMQVHGGSAIWLQTKALIPGLLVGLMWAVVLAAIGLALASASGRRAFSTGAVAIFLFVTWSLATVLTKIVESTPRHGPGAGIPAAEHLFGLISPYTTVDGVRQWLGGTSPGIVANPGHYGWAYAVMLLLFLGASLTALFARYSSVSVA
jgi:ABC-2 type transport system permease protein